MLRFSLFLLFASAGAGVVADTGTEYLLVLTLSLGSSYFMSSLLKESEE